MTIKEYLTEYMTNHGLFPDEADKVIDVYKAREDSMSQRMGDKIEGYPPEFPSVLLVTIRRDVVDWIDANKPKHWARGMFTDPSFTKKP